MADDMLSLSGNFETATEANWLSSVEKALKGKGVEALVKSRPGDPEIRPLYRETDFPSATDPLGQPGSAPFARGPAAQRDAFLPWDIRQAFTHPDPAVTNVEILRDLARGVSSVELKLDCTGETGVSIINSERLATALEGMDASMATIALDHGGGTGARSASLLALWAEQQAEPKAQKLAFNIDPLGALQRTGQIEGGLDNALRRCAAMTEALALRFPLSTALRVDARPVHEAGGSRAQELGALIAHGVDTLRRLDALGVTPDLAAQQILFTLAVDANYGVEAAKLRAARRLWARCLDALGIEPHAMKLQAVTSARMLTRYDAWVNMLRGTGACFGAAIGGADVITVGAFNAALGVPDELGRRVARNTQIIAMEESHLGKVADPVGGAWFVETLGEELAEAAWAEFQAIEAEGGYGTSLMADAFQHRVAEVRAERMKAVAKRKVEITGVSAFPLLDEVEAPVAEVDFTDGGDGVDAGALAKLLPTLSQLEAEDSLAEPFTPVRLAEPYERLRDHALKAEAKTGKRPAIFLATLGPLAEHTARADFARNFFAAGGIEAKTAPVPPEDPAGLVAAWKASGTRLAILCGSDPRYAEEAEAAATALKEAGVQRLYLAGKHQAEGVDSNIHVGVDVIAALELAHAELGIDQ
ncbi:MAG: methylmalonyl-CoA mutase family protein [Hyphomonadaceae bacterium]|nr:methylmalonyl-CoA mutase family protein [Hyphomonadaceae bacterium]